MKIFCCQTDILWEDKPANFERLRALVARASLSPGSLLLLPEMFATGFSMNAAALAEAEGGETESFMAAIATEFQVFVLGGVVGLDQMNRPQNQATAFSPEGRLLLRYSKMQPFTLGGESEHYAAGNRIGTFLWHNVTVAPFICYDLRFPELFRAGVLQGAELFAVIANWPVARVEHWTTLLQARAIENQAWVAGVNRCGTDPKFTYPGRSLIIDPHGKIVADAGPGENVISAAAELETVLNWRRDFPALEDMKKFKLSVAPAT